jgi:TolB-like protein/DNA-binding winged helix-turn-helix (wHTH) protein/tetratricopeptide (TPR) repeat protein
MALRSPRARMAANPSTIYRFRDFELDVAAFQLRRVGAPIHLERRAMELLRLLISRRGQLVTREDIVESLWPKNVVIDFETGVNVLVRKVRQALQDSADAPSFIETIPGKGYRFVAPVEESPSDAATPVRSRRALLAWSLAGIGFVAAAAVLVWKSVQPETPRVTIAVLPFDNLSGDPRYDYLADGLAEETGVTLGQVDPTRLRVISRMSAAAFKRSGRPVAESRLVLGADYVVESSIRAEGEQVRVTASLVRVDDQVQLWTASLDRALTSTLGVQQDLARAIAGQVRVTLSPERAAIIARRQTENPRAYDAYLRGRHEWARLTPDGNRRALEYFDLAIAEDADYALAWAGIATTLIAAPINSDTPPAMVTQRATLAARRAVQGAPDLAEALTAQAYLNFFLDWNWRSSESNLRRAIELDPNFALAHIFLGHVLSQMGQQAEARVMLSRARELDPLFPHTYAMSAQVEYQGRNFAAALEYAQQATMIQPSFWIGHIQKGQALAQLGRIDVALQAFDEAARYSGSNSKALGFRAEALSRAGREAEARAVLVTLEERAREKYVPPTAFANIHAALGERDAALEWLERAYDARDVHLVFLPVDPRWNELRNEARFRELIKRCAFFD